MAIDSELLSRIQMAFTLSYHILFPTLTIGLAWFLAFLEFLHLRTQKTIYRQHYDFWSKIFAITFGMGVVSGIVLSYEFGTNFGRFSEAAGNVIGPLMGYEVLSAFFLEAGFLGIMLFGWNRVSPKLHFFATCMVAFGTMMSAFWILSANSWMQTPAGHEFIDGKFFVKSWWDVVFNPSFPYRFSHMVVASFLTTAFFVLGVSGWMLWKKKNEAFAKLSFTCGIWFALITAPVQIFIGDLHGLNVLEHQPMKVAAMEAVWDTQKGAPFTLFAWPNMEKETNDFAITIPKAASLILTHDLEGELVGLKSVPPEDRPNVPLVFFSFRVMVGIGMLMLLTAVIGGYLAIRKKLFDKPKFFRWCVLMAPSGFIATVAGWWVAEVGRQPYLVYGLYRTSEGFSRIAPERVLESLMLFVLTYGLLLIAYLFYLFRLVRRGPATPPSEQNESSPTLAKGEA
ncbi:cytochrome ubiquinol oxidase subunit I [Pleionea sp. CnH1-48]|uniref:cytochrome ubiquinol oxidase subunit I n=1 Tax=Pleionea sp. CnH1-48 TaxID=2954494 RepID=UPI002097D2F6|nr:cytochrome ubiquinol oxidase subunit I [Pleionea sp. CnH1-48]MCO7223956.1 cytochrome ubiquinol oxidase subunit I [Pleionea sp. CnH1-48]